MHRSLSTLLGLKKAVLRFLVFSFGGSLASNVKEVGRQTFEEASAHRISVENHETQQAEEAVTFKSLLEIIGMFVVVVVVVVVAHCVLSTLLYLAILVNLGLTMHAASRYGTLV